MAAWFVNETDVCVWIICSVLGPAGGVGWGSGGGKPLVSSVGLKSADDR